MNRFPSSFSIQQRCNERGVALIEFALVLPVLLLLIVGGIELTRFVLANQKVDKVANQMADFVAQSKVPSEITAEQLKPTFQKLMSPFGTSNAGFVMSVIQPVGQDNDPEITSQTSDNASSQVGTEGQKLATKDIGGITLNRGNTLIMFETSYQHQNILGGLLEKLTSGPNAGPPVNLNGRNLYKKALYLYRLPILATARNPADVDLGQKPAICGYYRDADNQQNGGEPDEGVDRGDYDIWPIGSDTPHPCQCYSENRRPDLIQKLKTCRPELLASPYSCPSRDDTNNYKWAGGFIDNFVKPQPDKVCCPTASDQTKRCYGCIDTDDKIVKATSPGDSDCIPAPPPAPEPEPGPAPDPGPAPNPQPETPTPTPVPVPDPPFFGN